MAGKVQREKSRERFPVLRVGASVEMQSVRVLGVTFGMPYKTARVFLEDIDVPLVHIGKNSFFSIYALETAMFIVSDFKGPGLYAYGSEAKRRRLTSVKYKKSGDKDFPLKLRDEDIPKDLNKLAIRMERAGKARVSKITREVVKVLGKQARVVSRETLSRKGREESGGSPESNGGGAGADPGTASLNTVVCKSKDTGG